MIVVHVDVVDAGVDGRLDDAERGLVVGTDRVHDRVGADERLAQAVVIRDVDRLPRHAGLVADRRRAARVAVEHTELDRLRTGELVGDAAPMKSTAEQNELHRRHRMTPH